MNHEIVPSADLLRPHGLESKAAGLIEGFVHLILAEGEFVSGGRNGADKRCALLIWIQVALSLAGVALGVDAKLAAASYQPAAPLIVGVAHRQPIR